MIEAWRDIPGYGDYYQASNLGKIKSLDRVVMQKSRWGTVTRTLRKGRFLKFVVTNGGYLRVNLSVGEKRKILRIHTLVMLAFVGSRPENELVRHLDGNPKNNRLDNLMYGGSRANVIDIYRCGKTNGVLTINQVLEIRELLKNGSNNIDLAEKYGVGKESIRDIKNRKTFNWLGDDGVICES